MDTSTGRGLRIIIQPRKGKGRSEPVEHPASGIHFHRGGLLVAKCVAGGSDQHGPWPDLRALAALSRAGGLRPISEGDETALKQVQVPLFVVVGDKRPGALGCTAAER